MKSRLLLSFVLGSGCVAEDFGLFNSIELEIIEEELDRVDGPMTNDPTNAYAADPAAVVLGQRLFFDPRYSVSGKISCATCHDPSAGFQDARDNTSLGVGFTGRHTPSCLFGGGTVDTDTGTSWQFWDGRTDSLWAQALGPPENAVEMGGSRGRVAYLVHDRYRTEYEAVFGAMPDLRDEDGVALLPEDTAPGTASWQSLSDEERDTITRIFVDFGKAIDAYERMLVSTDSPFDRFRDEALIGDAAMSTALSPDQKRGLKLFIGKANCVQCHSGPQLSDGVFHNTGVAQVGEHVPAVDDGRASGIASVLAGEFNCVSKWSDHPNKSECAVAQLAAHDADVGAFKTPSLRNVASTAPYMHTGHLPTLEEVVLFYDRGGDESGYAGTRDRDVMPLGLTTLEIADLVAFLESLTGEPLALDLVVPPALP
jgi:cytochrome c peroxidase